MGRIREKSLANEKPDIQININNNNLTGPLITKREIEKAIKISKTNKATGPNEGGLKNY